MAETKNRDAPRQCVSTGPNARPLNDTISQTGPGVPDDTAKPVEVEPDEVRAIEQKIRSL